jgi:hypothetical protein
MMAVSQNNGMTDVATVLQQHGKHAATTMDSDATTEDLVFSLQFTLRS